MFFIELALELTLRGATRPGRSALDQLVASGACRAAAAVRILVRTGAQFCRHADCAGRREGSACRASPVPRWSSRALRQLGLGTMTSGLPRVLLGRAGRGDCRRRDAGRGSDAPSKVARILVYLGDAALTRSISCTARDPGAGRHRGVLPHRYRGHASGATSRRMRRLRSPHRWRAYLAFERPVTRALQRRLREGRTAPALSLKKS